MEATCLLRFGLARAHAEKFEWEHDGAWPISVRAAPSDGAANKAVESLVARAVGRAASTCSVARGHRSRDKMVRVQNIDREDARRRLEEFARGGS